MEANGMWVGSLSNWLFAILFARETILMAFALKDNAPFNPLAPSMAYILNFHPALRREM